MRKSVEVCTYIIGKKLTLKSLCISIIPTPSSGYIIALCWKNITQVQVILYSYNYHDNANNVLPLTTSYNWNQKPSKYFPAPADALCNSRYR